MPSPRSLRLSSSSSLSSSSVCSSSSTGTNNTRIRTYIPLPNKPHSQSLRFIKWAAGAPREATSVKRKQIPVDSDDRSVRSYFSTSTKVDSDAKFYWVTETGERKKKKYRQGSRQAKMYHVTDDDDDDDDGGRMYGAPPLMMNAMPPGGGFRPPPAMGTAPAGFPAGGMPPPPGPSPGGCGPGCSNLTGQHQPGIPFNAPSGGGFGPRPPPMS